MRRLENESELVEAAAAGDGAAFVALYDFHERTVFSFCRRLVGSADAAADATQTAFLDVLPRLRQLARGGEGFGVAVLAAARTACYALLERRPAHEEDAQRLPSAHARLRPRQRAVLALRELGGLGYAEIAAVMDMDRAAVPGLLARARLRLRDELQGSALAAAALASASCEEALPLLAADADGELGEGADAAWLETHLEGCESCGLTRRAMAEGVAAYRAWEPEAPPPWLRRATIADAAEQSGADWSGALAAVPPSVAPEQLAIAPASPEAGRDERPAFVAATPAVAAASASAAPRRPDRHAARRRRRATVVASSAGLALLAFAGLVLAAAGGIGIGLGGAKVQALRVPTATRTVELATAPARSAAPRAASRRARALRHRARSRPDAAVLASYAARPRVHRSAPIHRQPQVRRLRHRVVHSPRPVRHRRVAPQRRRRQTKPKSPPPAPPAPAPVPAPAPPAPQQTASASPPPSGSSSSSGGGTITITAPGCEAECKGTDGEHDHGHGEGNGNGHGNGHGNGNGAVPPPPPPTPAPVPPPVPPNGCAPAGQSCGSPPRCRPWASCHNDHGKGHLKLGAITAPAAVLMALAAIAWSPRSRRRRRASR